MASQEIKCSVSTCKYNDKMLYCSLNDIMVGSTVRAEARTKAETECASFEAE